MKKLAVLLALTFGLSGSGLVFAEHGKCPMGKCSMGMKDDCGKDDCGKDDCWKDDCGKGDMAGRCPITSKFMKKSSFLLANKDEIGLSEEQVRTVKELKLAVDKIVVAQGANMQLFALDADAKLSQDTVDVEGLNAMVDEGMKGMAADVKQIIDAYAKLKAVLTPDQMAKAKGIWKSKSSQCPVSGGQSHRH